MAGVPGLPPGAFIQLKHHLNGRVTHEDKPVAVATGGRQAAGLRTGIRLSLRQDAMFRVYSVQPHAGQGARVG